MKTHKRFSGAIAALLAVSTLATAVPAQAQEGRDRSQPRTMEQRQHRAGTPDWVAQRRASGATQAPAPSRPSVERSRERWDGAASRGNWNGERRDGSRGDWNRARERDSDRSGWNRDRDRTARDGNRDRDRAVWNRDRQTWNHGRDWNDNRRWDRDNRRDWNRDRFDNRNRWADQRRWDRDWRRDSRYDWQRYRSSNRGIYRMPRYYAPYGWNSGYRSFSIGVVLSSGLYGRDYWISDPGYYRLPPAYGYLRWVRYYDDALLVDVRDGYVVDVIRNFFW